MPRHAGQYGLVLAAEISILYFFKVQVALLKYLRSLAEHSGVGFEQSTDRVIFFLLVRFMSGYLSPIKY